ncbi:CD276 antigen-like, partial [Hemiscyllium ocellatum]|uniref:CD276 antigen-like n=1 Tax=Hemiscyllium ocellatum TaxID=170820 RepID=UPI002966DB76
CGACAHNASVARVGEDAVLPCVFVPASIDGLIIEWTLQQEDIRLAYSYHHGAARVLNQHPQFRDRAEVNESRLAHGEASLRLRNISIQDEGTYGCYVRSVRGKHEQTHQLLVAAPYSDPEVRCLSTRSWVTLSCVAWGGYPSSELHWRWANGSRIPAGAAGTRIPAAGGSYLLRAAPLQLPAGTEGRVRCLVTNPLLNQTAQSQAICQAGGGHPSTEHTQGCTRHCSPSAVHQEESRSRPGVIGSAVSLLLVVVMFVCVQYCRLQRRPA